MRVKEAARRAVLQKRDSLSYFDINSKSESIQKRIIRSAEFRNSHAVGVYYPVGSEVRTQRILDIAMKSSRVVALPRTEGDNIRFYRISSKTKLVRGKFGIKEPRGSSSSCVSENIDLLLVPGILFDINGYRIGYGYGYYDRFIAIRRSSISVIGLAYELQVREKIPRSEGDQKVDVLVTEKRTIHI